MDLSWIFWRRKSLIDHWCCRHMNKSFPHWQKENDFIRQLSTKCFRVWLALAHSCFYFDRFLTAHRYHCRKRKLLLYSSLLQWFTSFLEPPVRTKVWLVPQLTFYTSLPRLSILRGRGWFLVLPWPSCPSIPFPQE